MTEILRNPHFTRVEIPEQQSGAGRWGRFFRSFLARLARPCGLTAIRDDGGVAAGVGVARSAEPCR